MNKFIILLITLSFAFSQTPVPGKEQSNPILLKGGDLYTITNGIMKSTDILFDKGKIIQIGKNISAPANAEVVDVTGQHVYPGLIAPYTLLGLTEINAVEVSNDNAEFGTFTPEVVAMTAYNADSEITPVVRAHGITHALSTPSGGMISGRASFVQLDAWSAEHATVIKDAGLIVNMPRMSVFNAWWNPVPEKKQLEDIKNNIKMLHDYFEKARIYAQVKEANKLDHTDIRMEAMFDYMIGKKKVFITANSYKQIEAAVNLVNTFKLNAVLVQASDIMLAVDMVKASGMSVLLRMTQNVPNHSDHGYDQFYSLPAELAKTGIPFVLSASGRGMQGNTWGNSNLAFSAGQAVGFGLDKDHALRALTIDAAKMFGVEDQLGSLEVGKSATIVVSRGDILDAMTQKVLHEYIDGRKVDLLNRHKGLYNKFKQKNLK